MVTNSLPCPHGTCRPILPLTAPLAWAALGLRIPAQCRQQAGEPAQGQGMAAPKDPVLMDLEFTGSGSHREQEKHSQGRAMGKGPPAVALPAPAAAAQPSLASQTAHAKRWLRPPEERCRATPIAKSLGRGAWGGESAGSGLGASCTWCRRYCWVLGGEEGDSMLGRGRGEVCQLPAGQLNPHLIPFAWVLTPTSALAASMEQRAGPAEPRSSGPTSHPQPKVSPGLAGCDGWDHASPSPAHGTSSWVWGP